MYIFFYSCLFYNSGQLLLIKLRKKMRQTSTLLAENNKEAVKKANVKLTYLKYVPNVWRTTK